MLSPKLSRLGKHRRRGSPSHVLFVHHKPSAALSCLPCHEACSCFTSIVVGWVILKWFMLLNQRPAYQHLRAAIHRSITLKHTVTYLSSMTYWLVRISISYASYDGCCKAIVRILLERGMVVDERHRSGSCLEPRRDSSGIGLVYLIVG